MLLKINKKTSFYKKLLIYNLQRVIDLEKTVALLKYSIRTYINEEEVIFSNC